MSVQLLTPTHEADAAPSRGFECRVFERHSCGLPSKCQPASSFGRDDLKWSGTLENVSIGGVCLHINRRFEAGTGLAIELPGDNPEEKYTVLAKVVHVRRQDGAGWSLGCKFVSELSEDEVQRVLRHAGRLGTPVAQSDIPAPAKPVAAETQTDLPSFDLETTKPRRFHDVRLSIQFDAATNVECVIARFAAANGRWPLAAGSVGTLRGRDSSGITWSVKVKVRECHAERDEWKVDCLAARSTSLEQTERTIAGLRRMQRAV